MMFVDTNAVESHLLGKLKLVEIIVVNLVALHRIVKFSRGRIDPDRTITLREVIRQIRIWHQVEPMKLHARLSFMSTTPADPYVGAAGWFSRHLLTDEVGQFLP